MLLNLYLLVFVCIPIATASQAHIRRTSVFSEAAGRRVENVNLWRAFGVAQHLA
jgi:hypothetical protein